MTYRKGRNQIEFTILTNLKNTGNRIISLGKPETFVGTTDGGCYSLVVGLNVFENVARLGGATRRRFRSALC